MVKYIDTTNNYLFNLIKTQRYKNVFESGLFESGQVFVCCNQLLF